MSDGDDIELTIRESIEELKARNGTDEEKAQDESTDEADEEETEATETVPTTEKEAPAPPTEYVDPPHTWKADGKEWFKKQPIEAQKELRRRHDDMEKQFHNINTEWRKVKQESSDIDEALKPFERQWGQAGIPRAEGVQRLARAQMKLDANPQQAIAEIAKSYGLQVSFGGEFAGHTAPQYDQAPLRDVYGRIQSIEQALTAEREQIKFQKAQQTLTELHSVRDEKDDYGRSLRPELQDDQFVESLAPLYAGFQQREPDLTPSELLKRAYTAATGKNPESRQQQIEHSRKAQKATMSARIAPASSRPDTVDEEDNPNESPEETIRRTMRQLSRR